MGCAQPPAIAKNDELIEQKRCANFGCLRSAKLKQQGAGWQPAVPEGSDAEGRADGVQDAPAETDSPRSPWQRALEPLAAALVAEGEKPPLWWRSDSPAVASDTEASTSWKTLYAELQDQPLEDVLRRMPELGVRPWQSLWRRHSEELVAMSIVLDQLLAKATASASTQARPAGGAPPSWQQACQLLRRTAGGELHLKGLLLELASQQEEGMVNELASALAAKLWAQQQLLLLQEELTWLARVMASALAAETLRQDLLAVISTKPASEGNDVVLAEQGPAASFSASGVDGSFNRRLWSLALTGFHFQDILFRVVVDMDEWQTVCAEVQQAKHSLLRAGQGARLLVAVEGLGLRLVASPVLPSQEQRELPISQQQPSDSPCARWVSEYLRQLQVPRPSDDELEDWCAELPNPRALLTLKVPLAAAMRSASDAQRCAEAGRWSSPCLALVFGVAQGELTAARCGEPEVLCATSRGQLLEQVAKSLGCSASALKRFGSGASRSLFGRPCEVWYDSGNGVKNGAAGESVWAWQNDRFSVLFAGMPTRPPLESATQDATVPGFSAPGSLAERLAIAAGQLRARAGSQRYPWAVRAALRAQALPVRFACALAEPCLGTRQSPGSAKANEDLDEAVGVELLAAAAKHTVRHILTQQQQRQSSEDVIFPASQLSSPSVRTSAQAKTKASPDFALERSFASDSAATLESLSGVASVRGDEPRGVAQQAAILLADSAAGSRERVDSDQFGTIEAEPPIPPLQPAPLTQHPGTGARASPGSVPVSSQSLDAEVELLLGALCLLPQAPEAPAERLAALRLGLLQVAFWVRLAAAAWELQVTSEDASPPFTASDKDQEAASRSPGSTISSLGAVPKSTEADSFASLLAALGQRLLYAARNSSRCLVQGIAAHLQLEVAGDVMRRLRMPTGAGLGPLPMRLGLAASEHSGRPRGGIVLRAHFRSKGPMVVEDVLVEALTSGPEILEAAGVKAEGGEQTDGGGAVRQGDVSSSAQLAAELLAGGDLGLTARCHQGVMRRGMGRRLRAAVPQAPLFPGDAGLARSLSSSLAASDMALVRPGDQVQDHLFLQQHVHRAKGLLRFAQWLLLSVQHDGAEADAKASSTALAAASDALQAVTGLLSDLGGRCPPELLASLWTLRGYVLEKQGDIDTCYVQYLQALAAVDDAWGDPRRAGCHGHPFALLLVWKLGLISYCRSDLKCIEKFGDYFRALLIAFGTGNPFSWGAAALPPGERAALDSEQSATQVLRSSEALLWQKERRLASWWRENDILDFGVEGALPQLLSTTVSFPSPNAAVPGQDRQATSPSEGIVGDRQEVWRGTVFAFGSNELGQLGIGGVSGATSSTTDLLWSGSPVRVVALKECRMQDVACGESHVLAIDTEGQLYAWGWDEFHQVGSTGGEVRTPRQSPRSPTLRPLSPRDGSRNHMPTDGQQHVSHLPQRISRLHALGSLHFVAIACGAQFSLALDDKGCIWSWGSGEGGVLGLGVAGLSGRSAPTRLAPLSASEQSAKVAREGNQQNGHKHQALCKAVACGSYHAMALSAKGMLYSWGRAEGGQLGFSEERVASHIEECGLEDTCVCHPMEVHFEAEKSSMQSPGEKQEPEPVQLWQVAGGDVHSLALDSTGQVWSWGWGEFGQLGLGFSAASFEVGQGGMASKRMTPEAIPAHRFGDASAGGASSVACGGAFSAAIVGDREGTGGRLYLWGANEVGQCGQPAKLPEVPVPSEVPGLRGMHIRSVACGVSHAVAIDISGQVFSWGSAQFGQLGRSDPPRSWATAPGAAQVVDAQPSIIGSLARLRIMRAACGLHHTVLVSEVFSRKQGSARVRGLPEANEGSKLGPDGLPAVAV
eukprot:TRINITY_DN26011_c0_g1_i1.p1 TRINITY_DN26011_c0_g1~~TRINITY_DN26011_c0_g1_i1.p1  ORF type:complete len:1850 (+),score=391.79 TRINITY_DN26011_c0_g1_i1:34-5583(+)